MVLSTPSWFDEDFYARQKVDQMNAISYLGKNDWTRAGFESELARFNVTAYENFVYCTSLQDPAQTSLSPNPLFNVQEYLIALANFANSSGYAYEGYPTGQWTADMVLAHMLKDYQVSPWEHFYRSGQADGVNPSNAFDISAYYDALADRINAFTDPQTGASGYQGRTDWTGAELALQTAINNINPFEVMAANPIAAIAPVEVSPEDRVEPVAGWNPWTALDNPESPQPPDAPSVPSDRPGSSDESVKPGPSQPGDGSGDSAPGKPDTPNNKPDNPGNSDDPANRPAQPAPPATPDDGPGGSDPEPEKPVTPPATGGDDDNEEPEKPADPDQQEEIVRLVTGKSDYQGKDGVNTVFEGDINCNFGSFNPSTRVDGGANSVNTLKLNLISNEQIDGPSKGGYCVNVQNVELTASNGEKHINAEDMLNVQQWTVKGDPIAITQIDNPECAINIINLHSGGDAFDLQDGVVQTPDQFIKLNLGDGSGLNGTAVCHSQNIANVHVSAAANSGPGVYLNFEKLEYLQTDTAIDFAYDLHCNPREIIGGGTFRLASLTGSGIPDIDGGSTGCILDLGPATLNNDTYWVNYAYDSYGRECSSWQNVEKVIFNGRGLYMGETEGLKALEFTPLTVGTQGSNIDLKTSGESEFSILQHIANVRSALRIDGDELETINWNLTGSGKSGTIFLATSASNINIDASAVNGTIAIGDFTTPTDANVTYKGFAEAALDGDGEYAVAEAQIDGLHAANATLLGGAGTDSFSLTVGESAQIAGNGGNDNIVLKSGEGAGLVQADIACAINSSDNIALDAAGQQKMLVAVEGFGADDSLNIINGNFAAASLDKLEAFGINANGREMGNFIFDGQTAWGIAQNANGEDMICVALEGVSEEDAVAIFG